MGWGPFSYHDHDRWDDDEEDEREELKQKREQRLQEAKLLKRFRGNAKKLMTEVIATRRTMKEQNEETIEFCTCKFNRFLNLIEKTLRNRR